MMERLFLGRRKKWLSGWRRNVRMERLPRPKPPAQNRDRLMRYCGFLPFCALAHKRCHLGGFFSRCAFSILEPLFFANPLYPNAGASDYQLHGDSP